MITRVLTATVVEGQGEALRRYTENLGLEKRMDAPMGEDNRWTAVARKQKDPDITLAHWKWYGDGSKDQIGKNTMVVPGSTDCRRDHQKLKAKGVKFTDAPTDEPWRASAAFLVLYGNPYNLVQRKEMV